VIELDRCFRGEDTLMMEAVNISEMSVEFYQTTLRNIPEDCNLYSTSYKICAQRNNSGAYTLLLTPMFSS
jgi:hypothetical protein